MRGARRERRDATGWMIAAGVALALANATAYSIALFDPVIIAARAAHRDPRRRRQAGGLRRCLILLTVLIVGARNRRC